MNLMSMGDSNKRVCRLCLEVTAADECETIDEGKKELMEILLIKIDFVINDNAVACNRCLERLQDCFDFKSYVTTFVDVDVKEDIKNDFQKEMSREGICLEFSQVCRLCRSLIEDKIFNNATDEWKGGVLKDMVRNCFPEVDLNTVNKPLLCQPCINGTTKYYKFMKNCKEVRQRIENYCDGTAGKVILEDMLKYDDYVVLGKPIIIKNECSAIEHVDVNIKNYFKSESIASTQSDDDTKKEVDNSFRKDAFSKTENKERKTKSKVTKLPLKVNKITTKAYACRECPYRTDQSSNLVKHVLKHKDTLEVDMHKCALCPFKSKYKSTVVRHRKLLHDTDMSMYECKECFFSTKYKASLVSHQLLHNEKDTSKYKCEKCEYETKYKRCLVVHMLTHEDPMVVNKFKCEKCSFRGKRRYDLKRHMRSHSDKRPFSCDQCTYASNHLPVLLRHKLVHQKAGERQMYKCELCHHQAKSSVTIKSHMAKIHMAKTDSAEDYPKDPTLKCAHCLYETTVRKCLSQHMKRRHGRQNQPTLKCALCRYETTTKDDLRKHVFVHQEVTLQCDQCDFQTKRKNALWAHMRLHDSSIQLTFKCSHCKFHTMEGARFNRHRLTHMELGETTVYNCATCEFKTKYRDSLKVHLKSCLKKTSKDNYVSKEKKKKRI